MKVCVFFKLHFAPIKENDGWIDGLPLIVWVTLLLFSLLLSLSLSLTFEK